MTASAGGERSTFVVADSLAAQQWEMHLAAAEIGSGAAAWATPALTAYGAWLEELWLDNADERGTPLTVGQSAALWRRVLAESAEGSELIGHAGAAEWAADAWRLLQQWRIDAVSHPARGDELDYRAFLRWSRSYRERLDAHGWLDRAELEQALLARPVTPRGRVIAADLTEVYPARAALWAHLEASGAAPTALAAPAAVPAQQRAARLADAAEELRAALVWAQRQLGKRASARVAIVVPDLLQRHDEIERLVDATFGPGAPRVGWAEGRRLDADPVIGAALNALTLLTARAPYAAVGRWLRSPFFAAAITEPFARAALDRRLRNDLVSQLSFAAAYRCGLRDALEARAPQSAAALANALGTRGEARRATPSRWAHLFTRALAAFGWRPPAERATLAAWQASLDALARLTPILGETALDTALSELERILGRRAPSVLPLSGIHVLRTIDAVGPGYDAVWVTGFTDSAWPEPPHGNPLLPLALQRAHALPYSSPRDAQERSARTFERLLRRSRDLVVSWPARVYDFEAAPSPAIRGWPELAPTELDALTPASAADRASPRETVTDHAPPFAAARVPGGTGLLGRQARCPARAFCRDRLGARALEPLRLGLSPRARGTVTHRALELLCKGHPEQGTLVAATSAAIAACVEQSLSREFRRTRAALAELFALEAEQLERVIAAFLRQEAGRAPFRVRAVEESSDVVLGAWTFKVRVDRVDELADGSVAIIDYKTNERATSADWFAPRLRDAQVPLYACHVAGEVGAAAIARLTPTAASYSGVWRDGLFPSRRNSQAAAEPGAQLVTWRSQLLTLAEEFAAGDTRIFVAQYEDAAGAYAPLTRVFEQLALARGTVARW